MGLAHEHDMHKRRFGRNLGVGLTLAAFVGIVFGMTVVKVKRGDEMRSYEKISPAEQGRRIVQ